MESGSVDVVKLLLSQVAWLTGSGAFVLAAEAGHTAVVKLLLEKSADINELGIEDGTDERETKKMGSPLHKAAAKGHMDVVRLLLEKGAQIKLKDAKGRTALDIARNRGNGEVVQFPRSRLTA